MTKSIGVLVTYEETVGEFVEHVENLGVYMENVEIMRMYWENRGECTRNVQKIVVGVRGTHGKSGGVKHIEKL